MLQAESLIVALIVAFALAMVARRAWRVWRAATLTDRDGRSEGCGSCSGCAQAETTKQGVVGIGQRPTRSG